MSFVNLGMKRSGAADLPLHYGHVPRWLAQRMASLGFAITESIVTNYGKEEFLRSLNQGNLSNEVQKELRNLDSVIAQCPELGSSAINDSQFALSEKWNNNNSNLVIQV